MTHNSSLGHSVHTDMTREQPFNIDYSKPNKLVAKDRSSLISPLEFSSSSKNMNFMLSYLKTKFKKPIRNVLRAELDSRFETKEEVHSRFKPKTKERQKVTPRDDTYYELGNREDDSFDTDPKSPHFAEHIDDYKAMNVLHKTYYPKSGEISDPLEPSMYI